MFEVYGIRQVGSKELRYIGQTGRGRKMRLGFIVSLARAGLGDERIREWLQSCNFQVEAVCLDTANSREEAKAIEASAIRLFWAAGHGLLNRQGLPRGFREEPTSAPQPRRAA